MKRIILSLAGVAILLCVASQGNAARTSHDKHSIQHSNNGPENHFDFTGGLNDYHQTFDREFTSDRYREKEKDHHNNHHQEDYQQGQSLSHYGGGDDSYDCNRPPKPPCGVPEPGTLILLGSGLLGLVAAGRKKFRR